MSTVSCPGCGYDLDKFAASEPCPGCAGTRRSSSVSVPAAVASAVAITPSVSVGHQRFPTWHSLWAQINRRVDRLERIYEGSHHVESTGDLEDEVDALLLCIANMRDWMKADSGFGGPLQKQISNVTGRDPLSLCNDYANTFKHHTRRSGARYGRLSETTSGPNGLAVSLRYWRDDEPADEGSVDALHFAMLCIAEWRTFLADHGIEDPQPR